jgi:predicted enzyme related to lactoylglutathione lyase
MRWIWQAEDGTEQPGKQQNRWRVSTARRFVNRMTTDDGTGIPGGVGGGARYQSHVLFYVGVPDVEAALRRAESLGGKRRMGP